MSTHTTSPSQDECRKAFENWFIESGEFEQPKLGADGTYDSYDANLAWGAWSAAKAHPSAQGGQEGDIQPQCLADCKTADEYNALLDRRLAAQAADTMVEREAFEKWAGERGWDIERVDNPSGFVEFKSGATMKLWQGWQARDAQANDTFYEDVYSQCQELIEPHVVTQRHGGSACGESSLCASVVESLGYLVEFWLKHRAAQANAMVDVEAEYLPGDAPTKASEALEILGRVKEGLRAERHDSYEAVSKVKALFTKYLSRPATPDRALLERVRDALGLLYGLDRIFDKNAKLTITGKGAIRDYEKALATLNDMLNER